MKVYFSPVLLLNACTHPHLNKIPDTEARDTKQHRYSSELISIHLKIKDQLFKEK